MFVRTAGQSNLARFFLIDGRILRACENYAEPTEKFAKKNAPDESGA